MIGEIVIGEGEEVMDVSHLGSTCRFLIALQCVGQLSALCSHVAEFKKRRTEIAQVVGKPMCGNCFLQVALGGSKIAALHCQCRTKQAMPACNERHALC